MNFKNRNRFMVSATNMAHERHVRWESTQSKLGDRKKLEEKWNIQLFNKTASLSKYAMSFFHPFQKKILKEKERISKEEVNIAPKEERQNH